MEIEVKAKLKDLKQIRKRLLQIPVQFSKSKTQVDHYYKLRGREMELQKPGSYLIRIREDDDKNYLTMKKLTKERGVWEEHELAIENYREMDIILREIGFVEIFTLHKKRTITKYKNYKICLDDVRELGPYLEIELVVKKGDFLKLQDNIKSFMFSLGIQENQIEKRGYPQILLMDMGVKYEERY